MDFYNFRGLANCIRSIPIVTMVITRSGTSSSAEQAECKQQKRTKKLKLWRTKWANEAFDFMKLHRQELIDLVNELDIAIPKFQGPMPMCADYVWYLDLHFAQQRLRLKSSTNPTRYLDADFRADKQTRAALRQILALYEIRYFGANKDRPTALASWPEILQVFEGKIDGIREGGVPKFKDVPSAGIDSGLSHTSIGHTHSRAVPLPPRSAASTVVHRTQDKAPADSSPRSSAFASRSSSASTIRTPSSTGSALSDATHDAEFGNSSKRKVDISQHSAAGSEGSAQYSYTASADPLPSKSDASMPTARKPSDGSFIGILSSRKIVKLSSATERAFDAIISSLRANKIAEAFAETSDFLCAVVEELPDDMWNTDTHNPASNARLSQKKILRLVQSAANAEAGMIGYLKSNDIEQAAEELSEFLKVLEAEL
ncbi:hypothetical protein LTR91_000221 [Friedmanniomyces endolithicus]|uniref:Uncharacterized protein n=1 Tax=Friedmanniomyces endolithicus TaxID=329885 RepID=A0AAN6R2I7_9PEZI|nr:hypothetical protein LTR35_007560 [Friedmanniomyces endolithicus]KAK0295148.1 hypothetical protein LTS00_006204 [Friedmanniomyces endolithicus]KAK0317296.1 hypothetical protein LTR82_011619 [Friedmanniomyces endolithicus]KAK0931272.1 hypothetical protein LTR57_000687 [Friedmanniomyces endolithicus]KAK1010421.1 hypothetical protein LTR54_005376 [Friedmanniomyces endolithicus]